MTRGGIRYDGSPSWFDHGFIGRLAVDSPHDRGALDQINRDRSSNGSIIGQRRQHVEELSIAVRSSHKHTSFVAQPSPIDRQAIDEGCRPRSWPDRGPIVARSWPYRGGNRGYLEAKLKPNSHQFVAELKPRSMPTESPPRRYQNASTIASITHDFKPNFLFKSMYFPSLFFNF